MIRVVSFHKALLAGAAGALAWELTLRPLLLAGAPVVDLVRLLGEVAVPNGPHWAWWLAGMAVHLTVGVLWAIFYAYVFWSLFIWRPVVQGLVFAIVPAVLAELIVFPQLRLMHTAALFADQNAWTLLQEVPWSERAALLLGHATYGAALGALYTRPVGYPADRAPRPLRRTRLPKTKVRAPAPGAFIFATGVECSYPLIERGRWRRDQMSATGHYRNWARDLDLAAELGLTHLRYGPPLHLTCPARGSYDWDWADPPLEAMREMGFTPIVDLCHFGLPEWLESFQNDEVPAALADYAAAFAGRYPWVRFYTPVNEMYVCARLSALDGLWNEQARDERAFVTAVSHAASASLSMMDRILERRDDAVFVTSESGEFFQAASPEPHVVRIAAFENERRFLSLDLVYGHPVSDMMRAHLLEHGMAPETLDGFLSRQAPRRTILGVDYYDWNEKLIDTGGQPRALGELFGWYVIASQYYDRYRRPMMHTETNHLDAREAPRWIWRQWHNLRLIQQAGVPVVGFTWYSLTDQIDWDVALSQALGNVNPVGLFDLNRDVRTVGLAYKHLIESYRGAPGIAECATLKEILA